MVLTRSQARSFYDRFGSKQDGQGFYEDGALDEMIAHAGFERAESLVELGCGTGRLAGRLLEEHLPGSATYTGIDLSRTMVDLARDRLAPFGERARVMLSEGAMSFPLERGSVDRVVSTYVLDLLPEAEVSQAISEAHRVLAPGGLVCLVSLTRGVTPASRLVSALWAALFRIHARWVGGCRPLRLLPFFDRTRWSIEYRNVTVQFGVPSEILIARPIQGGG